MELPINETPDAKTEQCRTFEVIVSRRGGGEPRTHCVGWALQDADDLIYVYLKPFKVLQDSADCDICLMRKEMEFPPE